MLNKSILCVTLFSLRQLCSSAVSARRLVKKMRSERVAGWRMDVANKSIHLPWNNLTLRCKRNGETRHPLERVILHLPIALALNEWDVWCHEWRAETGVGGNLLVYEWVVSWSSVNLVSSFLSVTNLPFRYSPLVVFTCVVSRCSDQIPLIIGTSRDRSLQYCRFWWCSFSTLS